MRRLIKALAFISVIIIVECVVAAKLLPTPQDTEEVGKRLAAVSAGKDDLDASEEEAPTVNSELREVDLGAYNISSYQPDSNTTLRIDVELFGTVLANDQEDFIRLYASNQHRLREQVETVLRGAQIGDLNDAGLGLIKRQILAKSNRILGKPLLQQVIFSKFSFMER